MSDERSLFPCLEKIKKISDTEKNEWKHYVNQGHYSLNLFIHTSDTHNLFFAEVIYIHDEQKKVKDCVIIIQF